MSISQQRSSGPVSAPPPSIQSISPPARGLSCRACLPLVEVCRAQVVSVRPPRPQLCQPPRPHTSTTHSVAPSSLYRCRPTSPPNDGSDALFTSCDLEVKLVRCSDFFTSSRLVRVNCELRVSSEPSSSRALSANRTWVGRQSDAVNKSLAPGAATPSHSGAAIQLTNTPRKTHRKHPQRRASQADTPPFTAVSPRDFLDYVSDTPEALAHHVGQVREGHDKEGCRRGQEGPHR